VQFALDIDFTDGDFGNVYDLSSSADGADWGADWGSDWGAPVTTKRKWIASRGYGRAVGPALRTRSSALNVKWFSSDLRGTIGGQL
jgi:hypothetical protein